MTLRPVDAGELARSVNGDLVDMTLDEFRKYEANIQCTDHEAPELTDVWRGKQVIVSCIPGLGVGNNTDGDILTMTMMVQDWETRREDWEASTAWSLDLVEV